MKLKVAKSKIQMTECADIVCDGLYCSEPIITLDTTGNIIDNYFTFSRSSDFTQITIPQTMFGIYSDFGKTAYINKAIPSVFDNSVYQESFEDADTMKQAFKRYDELYPLIRDSAYHQITNSIEKDVADYFHCLHIISGDALFSFYKKLYPEFFEWAKDVSKECV